MVAVCGWQYGAIRQWGDIMILMMNQLSVLAPKVVKR